MPTFEVQRKVAELEHQLAMLTGHQRARVKPYGKHLLIQMHSDGGVHAGGDTADTIARLTELAHNSYSAAFRSHTGRWEPLPGTGDLATVADLVVSLLSPYFEPIS